MEIRARKVDIDRDIGSLSAWHINRGMPYADLRQLLPANGWIVDNVCAVFLYLTDSKFVFLDSMVSNPEASKERRGEGMRLCLDAMVKFCLENDIHVASFVTNINAVKQHSKEALERHAEHVTCVSGGQGYELFYWVNKEALVR